MGKDFEYINPDALRESGKVCEKECSAFIHSFLFFDSERKKYEMYLAGRPSFNIVEYSDPAEGLRRAMHKSCEKLFYLDKMYTSFENEHIVLRNVTTFEEKMALLDEVMDMF